ncbi:hypothetical protein [Pseudomonas sp. NPDC090208]|uniref:hypothetical protein n=1 Tax=Pseudomonas sp. NPDC090208 TaxID=3364478 RepID=UPI0037F50A20
MDRESSPRNRIAEYDLKDIEAPFFAVSKIERSLYGQRDIYGLNDLIRECRLRHECGNHIPVKRVLEKIRRGDWLLATRDPFSPLSEDTSGKYAHITGKRSPWTDHIGACGLLSPSQPSPLMTPRPYIDEASERPPINDKKGPGRWVTKEIDYDGIKNSAVFLANRLTSMGDEGRAFGSDGKDYANTSRTVIQEWQPLTDDQLHLAHKSVIREFGELRKIKQQYLEGNDDWQISGSSWHWQPVTADVIYELKED